MLKKNADADVFWHLQSESELSALGVVSPFVQQILHIGREIGFKVHVLPGFGVAEA